MPDSWLILYNLNNPDSVAWANWYQLQRGIPLAHMVGLSASLDENLPDLAAVQSQIIEPVRTMLDSDPDLQDTIMGIVLGYGMPGSYAFAPAGGPGGFSVTDALQDMYDDTLPPAEQKEYNPDNPQLVNLPLPAGGRLTRATMGADRYMTARIDAPSLELAMALTTRAQLIESDGNYLNGQLIYYDYFDSAMPNGQWGWLRNAVLDPIFAGEPWQAFDSDTEQSPNDAIRIHAHGLTGWNDQRLRAPQAGARVMAYDFNSWGATTVRSITAEGGRFVPNAIDAGYASAFGATGEPLCCTAPLPRVFLASMREGWTLAESFYLCNPFDDWMWTVVGDPLLRMPHWFDEAPPVVPGDMNGDGVIDGHDIHGFVVTFSGNEQFPWQLEAADLDVDGDVDQDDAFLFRSPLLFEEYASEQLKGTGDANADDVVNGLDVAAYIHMVLHGTEGLPLQAHWCADMNRDQKVDLNDLTLFVDRLVLPL